MIVGIVGIGLMGGSLALCLQQKTTVIKIIGIDASIENANYALQHGLVHEVATIEEAAKQCDVVFIAIPVDASIETLQAVLKHIKPTGVVVDMGSTKLSMCAAIEQHPNRKQYVATHPMWGTEFSGPAAAVKNAFEGRACVICNKEQSSNQALQLTEQIFTTLGMHIIYMSAESHDVHAAYVSHISHITSFALANTVLEKEREEDAIFEMAGGGFESTVRLAKSNPKMWVPIFKQNKENVLDVLNEHISQLRKFKTSIEKENWELLEELIVNANKIKKIIN
jgi:prephenate dehydrogenase